MATPQAASPAARDAHTALTRFGLGARPGDIAQVTADPRGYVLAALARKSDALLDDADLDTSQVLASNVMLANRQQRMARESAQEALREGAGVPFPRTGGAPPTTAPAASMPPMAKAVDAAKAGPVRREVYLDEAAVRFERFITTNVPFLERLVMFWSNHFCVSAGKANVRAIAGAFEREAIRPHVLGKFTDMLLAVEQHPAMLMYLDNQLSFGPNSPAGKNRNRGLNENLAREILELHTLGVDGGYTQDDVTNLARVITGWTVGNFDQGARAGRFWYHIARAEPGNWTVLGRSYRNVGVEAGENVLKVLATHPATARHVARNFAAHFVSDPPPPALVGKLEESFIKSGGDLGQLARTLVASDLAWQQPKSKMLPPNDFLIAMLRGLPFKNRPQSRELVRLSNELGQPLWAVPSPKGWPDSNDAWAGPSALRERLRIAEMVTGQIDKAFDPRAAAENLMGPALSKETAQAIARAETRDQGLQLLVMSPEFQRR